MALWHCCCKTTVQCYNVNKNSKKTICSSRYMVTDQHWTTDKQIEHSRLSGRIRERRPEQNGLQRSAEDGKRRRVPNILRQSVPCPCGSHCLLPASSFSDISLADSLNDHYANMSTGPAYCQPLLKNSAYNYNADSISAVSYTHLTLPTIYSV